MITIALSKGRQLKDFIKYLKEVDSIYQSYFENIQRELVIETETVKFLLVKGDDVPTYVAEGTADLGITGSDVLIEQNRKVNHLLDLPFGLCHFAVAAKPEVNIEDMKIVASKYINIAQNYFYNRGMDTKVIKLNGSVELAALIGMSDGIIDIVQSGETLRMNNLIEKDYMFDVNARLICNKHAYFTKSEAIQDFIKQLKVTK
ncbi:ATP phosphoribosyltransferase [Macrococcus animalis]|uniref:ATP phosphoribosyltransferase n=1 Tax=Macrococcus animalis TaxID=3395467 RepID=UPI0039BFE0E6